MRLLLAFALVGALACASGPDTAPAAPVLSPAPAAVAPVAATPVAAAPAAVASSDARPLYYHHALTDADLRGRSLRELALMRNTIFARHGHPFVKPWLNTYFMAQPWYTPRAAADLGALAVYDSDNVAQISRAEQALTRDDLLAMRAAVRAGPTTAESRVEFALIGAALGVYSGEISVPVAQRNPLEDPDALAEQLTVAQITGLSRRDLRLVRNTIYARHGRPFTSNVLQVYYGDKEWYSKNSAFNEGMLTAIDKRNIQLVQSMEDRLGGPMTEWEHQKEEGWFEGA